MAPSRAGGVVNPYAGFIDALAKKQAQPPKDIDAMLAQIQKMVLQQGLLQKQQGSPAAMDGAVALASTAAKAIPEISLDPSVVYDSDSYIKNTASIESSNNPAAFNAGSKATGLYQFIPETWAAIQKQAPHLELTDDGRTDPTQSLRAMKYLTAQNAGILKQALGRQPTHAELYTAHLLGPGWASAILRAPETPVATLIPTKFIESNPMLKGVTAQTLLQNLGRKYNR